MSIFIFKVYFKFHISLFILIKKIPFILFLKIYRYEGCLYLPYLTRTFFLVYLAFMLMVSSIANKKRSLVYIELENILPCFIPVIL